MNIQIQFARDFIIYNTPAAFISTNPTIATSPRYGYATYGYTHVHNRADIILELTGPQPSLPKK